MLADVLGSTIDRTCYVHIGLPEQAPRQERIQELAQTVAEVWFRSLPPRAALGVALPRRRRRPPPAG